jgi:hypothetical protein
VQIDVADSLKRAEDAVADLRDRLGGMDEELDDLVGSALHYVFLRH